MVFENVFPRPENVDISQKCWNDHGHFCNDDHNQVKLEPEREGNYDIFICSQICSLETCQRWLL